MRWREVFRNIRLLFVRKGVIRVDPRSVDDCIRQWESFSRPRGDADEQAMRDAMARQVDDIVRPTVFDKLASAPKPLKVNVHVGSAGAGVGTLGISGPHTETAIEKELGGTPGISGTVLSANAITAMNAAMARSLIGTSELALGTMENPANRSPMLAESIRGNGSV